MIKNLPFTVIKPETATGTFNITVHVALVPPTTPAEVINYIRSMSLKQDLMNGWVRENAPNHGLETRGGPRPVTKDPNDLSTEILAYEQDYRLCQRI